MAGNGCQQGFRSVVSIGFGGQESASKPPQAICKPLPFIVKKKTTSRSSTFNFVRTNKIKRAFTSPPP